MVADTPDVDVIIVVSGAGTGLEAAVASVEDQVAPGRVVVVDPGGAEAAVEAVTSAHPGVHFVHANGTGPATEYNAGIAATSDEFVLLLDSDSVLEDRCLRPLVSRARSNRAAGIIAPRLTLADGSTRQGSFGPFPTLRQGLIERVNLITHRMSGGRTSLRHDINGTTTVDWVSTACVLARRSAMTAVGPMDEDYTARFEDVDWCRRMRTAGWTVLVEPMATCIHEPVDGASGDSAKALAAYRADFYRYLRTHRLGVLAVAARIGLVSSRPQWTRG